MIISNKTVWVIMSKDRLLIAKGNVRNRSLIPTDDDSNKERILTYSTKGKATAAFKVSGFYNEFLIKGYERDKDLSEYLEPVEVSMQMVSFDGVEPVGHPWVSTKHSLPNVGVPVEVLYKYCSSGHGVFNDENQFEVKCENPNGVGYRKLVYLPDVRYWRYS